LKLIEEQSLPITEISLSQVTEQYINYLHNLEEYYSEELANFLVIASRLVYLKSKTLLPYLYPEEEEGPSLADQLKLYKQYIEASKEVNRLWNEHTVSYGRIEPPRKYEAFNVPTNAGIDQLYQTMVKVLKRLKPLNPLPQMSIDRSVSVKQKIEAIYQALKNFKRVSFNQIVLNAENKTEVIVSFLAILELVKQERVTIQQPLSFEELTLRVVS
jgi:segregation and condensation protein A